MQTTRTDDGITLAYEVTGPQDGPPVALVMGLGMGGRAWGATTHHLADHGFRVITLDNRGAGRSQTPRKPFTTRRMARDVVEVLDAAGVDGPAHVVGVSLGGMIAQEVALQHPERTLSLSLQSTTGGLPRLDLFPVPGITAMGRGMLAGPPKSAEEALERFLRVAAGPDFDAEGNEAVRLMLASPAGTATGTLQQLAAVIRHRTWGRLGQISAPTLVQHGSKDKLIDVRAGRALARRIPDVVYREHARAGHVLTLERPAALRELTGHLAQAGRVREEARSAPHLVA